MAVLNLRRTFFEHRPRNPDVNQSTCNGYLVQSVYRGHGSDVCWLFHWGTSVGSLCRRNARTRSDRNIYPRNRFCGNGAAICHRVCTAAGFSAQAMGVGLRHHHYRHRHDELLLHPGVCAPVDILVKARNKGLVWKGSVK